jgi:hypothetical protein
LHSNGKITVFDFVTLSRVSKGPKHWAKLFRCGLRGLPSSTPRLTS